MSAEAFCYFGLLRRREPLERILALLPEARREAAAEVIESCAGRPEVELRQRLEALLRADSARWRNQLALPPEVCPERLSPVLRRWLDWRSRSRHERQDHQG